MIEKLAMMPVQPTANQLPDAAKESEQTPVKTFGEFLADSLEDTNRLQKESARMKALLAAGKVNDVAEVVIAGQKAQIALNLTVQIRNKAIDAYQELMRMQV